MLEDEPDTEEVIENLMDDGNFLNVSSLIEGEVQSTLCKRSLATSGAAKGGLGGRIPTLFY